MTRKSFSLANLITCVAIFVLASLTLAGAQTESVIHGFRSTSVFDGKDPLSGVVADKNGALYGTAGGGKYGPGVVYKLVPPATQGGAWKQTILYPFGSLNGANDGSGPSGNIVLTESGKIYGTTRGGGIYGKGIVYELSPPTQFGKPWTETVLYNFTGTTDGGEPFFGVIAGTGGRLYGTTELGGRNGSGTAFAISPPAHLGNPWTERVLYSFEVNPFGPSIEPSGLALAASGSLYGTTGSLAEDNAGTVFQLNPPSGGTGPWTESVIYSFTAADGGLIPGGGVILDSSGAIYGTTQGGGQSGNGTVYELTPPATQGGAWTESVLYSFSAVGTGDGAIPAAGVIFDTSGALYGTTYQGGNGQCSAFGPGCGTVFKLSPPVAQGDPWAESLLYSFQGGSDGAYPATPAYLLGTSSVYGTPGGGGSGPCNGPNGPLGCGTVFEVTQ